MSKPLLLICNDDGIHAPGIRALVEAVKDLGDLVVVAPDRPQSGMGHAITIGFPLRVQAQEGLFWSRNSGLPDQRNAGGLRQIGGGPDDASQARFVAFGDSPRVQFIPQRHLFGDDVGRCRRSH